MIHHSDMIFQINSFYKRERERERKRQSQIERDKEREKERQRGKKNHTNIIIYKVIHYSDMIFQINIFYKKRQQI